MKNQTLLFASLAIIIVAALLPIGVNLLLNSSVGVTVAGEAKDWLSFYGSYIGGIFTAFISFLILFKTVNRNKLDSEIQYKKQELDNLKLMLSEQVSMLDFARVGIVSLVINNSSQYSNEIQKLDIFHEKLTRKFNSYSLFYSNSTDKLANNYWEAYRKCVGQLFDDITEMTQLISNLPPKEIAALASERLQVISKINDLNKLLSQHKQQFTEKVFEEAQVWLQSETENLNKLRKC